ncbi:hypothetical protein B0H14DRAFT_2648546 [Mycena olivaceomarginata]|nr:hypothetical protein B0H14DRAFT_2648546 [Mycena olivaceomarginata]
MEWQTNAAQINPIFFLVYNLLGAVVILTLFVRSGHPLLLGSIIIGNFSSKKGSAFLTAAQRGVAPLAFVSAHEYVPGRDQASRSVARSATYSVLSKTALGGVIDLSTVCRAYDPSRAPQHETPAHHAQAQPLLRPRPNKGRARHHAQAAVRQQQHPSRPPRRRSHSVRQCAARAQRPSSRPTRDPWTAPVTQTTPARSASQAPPLPPQQSQSFRGEEATAAPPSANEWMANYDPWTSGGDENQNYDQQQSQKQFEPEKKREAPSSIRGGLSPFRDRVNDNQTPNRSSNEGSANLLDVRGPSQAPHCVARERPQRRPDRASPRQLTGRAPAPRTPRRTRFRLRRISSLPRTSDQRHAPPPQGLLRPAPRLEVVLVPMVVQRLRAHAHPQSQPHSSCDPLGALGESAPPPTLCSLRTLFLRATSPRGATPAPARVRGHHDVPRLDPLVKVLFRPLRDAGRVPLRREQPPAPAIGADVRPERRKSGRAALRSDDAPPSQSSEASPGCPLAEGTSASGANSRSLAPHSGAATAAAPRLEEARPRRRRCCARAHRHPQLRDDDVPPRACAAAARTPCSAPADALVLFHRSSASGCIAFFLSSRRDRSRPNSLHWLSRRGSPRITPHKVIRAAGRWRADLASREPLGVAGANGLVLPFGNHVNGSGNEHGGGANNANGTANGPPPSTFSRSWDRDQHQRMLMQQVQTTDIFFLSYSHIVDRPAKILQAPAAIKTTANVAHMVSLWVPADEVFPAILERTKADPQAFLNVHTGEPFSAWPSNSFYAQAYLGGLRVAAALRHADAQLSHMVEELSAFTICPQLEVLEKLVFPRKKVNKREVEYIQRYQYTVLSEIERQGKRGFLSHKKLSLSD